MQPIPDYVRWVESKGELHFLSTEQTRAITLSIKDLQLKEGIFIPETLIQHMHTISTNPPEDVIHSLAILCWLPMKTVKGKFKELNEKMEKDLNDSHETGKWSKHQLFSFKVSLAPCPRASHTQLDYIDLTVRHRMFSAYFRKIF